MTLLSRTNFFAGLFFIAIGLSALYIGQVYPMGSAARMGPGYFPALLAFLLVGLGLAIAVRACRREGPPPRTFKPWPLLIVSLSVALFALLVDRAGIAVATAVLVVGARLAAPGRDWREIFALAVALSGAAVGIFGYGLGIAFPLWPL
ncbi:tripartite tricarboxylate transporter TctB family protein [Pseudomonas sp. NPDC007930]|uniref:tripartite tricarboxylate transporter TctB family protein n=1 Tax=Pseudomonas sp. NPDC007930 TaxID=3364417 RepID=UPI0036E46F56